MEVEVTLYGMLRQHRPAISAGAPHHPFAITLPDGATIADLLHQLEIPPDIAVVAHNGQTAEATVALAPQDKLSIFPPTAGG